MQQLLLPEQFIKKTLDLFGDRGQDWLDHFPEFISTLEKRWEIKLLHPFELSYNYVAPGICKDGTEVVLKTWLVNVEMLSEMESLRLWDGRGIVKLLKHDADQGAMLLERIRPGTTLADVSDDDQATMIAAEVMKQLWIPAGPDHRGILRTVKGWAQGLSRLREEFDGGFGPFPSLLVQAAESLFTDLLANQGPLCLLHGDLHHWNILSAQRQPWLALDPKGLIGEVEYEPGALLRNRLPEHARKSEITKLTKRRIDIICEILGIDKQRVISWAMAQAVLSAWWSYEDHHIVDKETLLLSEVLLDMIC